MNFTRTKSSKKALNVGVIAELPGLMEEYGIDFDDWYEILEFSIVHDRMDIFNLIFSLDGTDWEGTKIDIKECVNDILWDIIVYNRIQMAHKLLEIPNLFPPHLMNLDDKKIRSYDEGRVYNRGRQSITYTLGFYYHSARNKKYFEIETAIKEYYENWKKNAV